MPATATVPLTNVTVTLILLLEVTATLLLLLQVTVTVLHAKPQSDFWASRDCCKCFLCPIGCNEELGGNQMCPKMRWFKQNIVDVTNIP